MPGGIINLFFIDVCKILMPLMQPINSKSFLKRYFGWTMSAGLTHEFPADNNLEGKN